MIKMANFNQLRTNMINLKRIIVVLPVYDTDKT